MGLDTIHWISSGLASFARGTSDAPKIVAMLLLGSATAAWPDTSSQLAAFGGSQWRWDWVVTSGIAGD